MIDLVRIAPGRPLLPEHFHVTAPAAIEIKPEYSSVPQKVEPCAHSKDVFIESARLLQIMGEDADMRELPHLDHRFPRSKGASSPHALVSMLAPIRARPKPRRDGWRMETGSSN
jgi:hypothetical protein